MIFDERMELGKMSRLSQCCLRFQGAKLNTKEGKLNIFNPSDASHPVKFYWQPSKRGPPGTGAVSLHVRQYTELVENRQAFS